MTGPAFILGNSPQLPTDDLDCLDGQFCVGVNRILLSGFTPTVLIWIDGTVYKNDADNRALMDETDALLVCDRSVAQTQAHHGLLTHVGCLARTKTPKPRELCCNRNTGVCAALWAFSLGCSPVYLVGMDAKYAPGGKTDFWGDNRWHNTDDGAANTLTGMRGEIDRLVTLHGDGVIIVSGGQELREAAGSYPARDQGVMRRSVLQAINACEHATR